MVPQDPVFKVFIVEMNKTRIFSVENSSKSYSSYFKEIFEIFFNSENLENLHAITKKKCEVERNL